MRAELVMTPLVVVRKGKPWEILLFMNTWYWELKLFLFTTEHKDWQLMEEEMEASLVLVMDTPARITLEEEEEAE